MVQPSLGTAPFLASEELCVTGRQLTLYKKAKLVIYYYYFKHSKNEFELVPGLKVAVVWRTHQ